MTTIWVEVTAEDIREGVALDSRECPVARAIRRGVRPGLDVEVGPDEICVGEYIFFTTVRVEDFLWGFDLGQVVEPFAFGLDVPDELLANLPGEGPTGPG
jgi:hypothetical protein